MALVCMYKRNFTNQARIALMKRNFHSRLVIEAQALDGLFELNILVNFGSNVMVALAFAPLHDLVGELNTFIIKLGLINITILKTKGLNL